MTFPADANIIHKEISAPHVVDLKKFWDQPCLALVIDCMSRFYALSKCRKDTWDQLAQVFMDPFLSLASQLTEGGPGCETVLVVVADLRDPGMDQRNLVASVRGDKRVRQEKEDLVISLNIADYPCPPQEDFDRHLTFPGWQSAVFIPLLGRALRRNYSGRNVLVLRGFQDPETRDVNSPQQPPDRFQSQGTVEMLIPSHPPSPPTTIACTWFDGKSACSSPEADFATLSMSMAMLQNPGSFIEYIKGIAPLASHPSLVENPRVICMSADGDIFPASLLLAHHLQLEGLWICRPTRFGKEDITGSQACTRPLDLVPTVEARFGSVHAYCVLLFAAGNDYVDGICRLTIKDLSKGVQTYLRRGRQITKTKALDPLYDYYGGDGLDFESAVDLVSQPYTHATTGRWIPPILDPLVFMSLLPLSKEKIRMVVCRDKCEDGYEGPCKKPFKNNFITLHEGRDLAHQIMHTLAYFSSEPIPNSRRAPMFGHGIGGYHRVNGQVRFGGASPSKKASVDADAGSSTKEQYSLKRPLSADDEETGMEYKTHFF